MKNNITSLEIKNFKSLKDIKMDCKRINVFIGEPNVGKSNILEALSLFIAPYSDANKPFLKDYIRYEKLSNLFYDQDRKNIVSIITNIGAAFFRFHMNSINSYDITLGPNKSYFDIISNKLNISGAETTFSHYVQQHSIQIDRSPTKPFYTSIVDSDTQFRKSDSRYFTPIKRYTFQSLTKHENPFTLFLNPPYGNNLYSILESNPKLYDDATHFFAKYGLDLLIDTETNKLDVQKRVGNRVYKIPYSLAADTLQRIIFHLSAIETNDDSILLFEEPEAHAFPKYISLFAEKIIESKNNQFFIATHSQYLLTPFIEQCPPEDIAIFVCTYENYETKVRVLSNEEIGNIMETGIDLFYNIPAFQK